MPVRHDGPYLRKYLLMVDGNEYSGKELGADRW